MSPSCLSWCNCVMGMMTLRTGSVGPGPLICPADYEHQTWPRCIVRYGMTDSLWQGNMILSSARVRGHCSVHLISSAGQEWCVVFSIKPTVSSAWNWICLLATSVLLRAEILPRKRGLLSFWWVSCFHETKNLVHDIFAPSIQLSLSFGELAAAMRPRFAWCFSVASLLLNAASLFLLSYMLPWDLKNLLIFLHDIFAPWMQLLTMLLHMFYEVSKEWPTKTRITSYDKTEKWFLWPTTTCVVLSANSFHAQSLSNQMVLFKSNIQPLVCIYK